MSLRNSALPGVRSLMLLQVGKRRAAAAAILFSFWRGKSSGLGNADPKGTISRSLSPLSLQEIWHDRRLAQPHARCGINSIEDGRDQGGGSRFTHAPRGFVAFYDVDVD
jgi:hypothetical protein